MPKTLLVADDSVTIRKVVTITFANDDFKVVAVDNGDDALAKARELKPDIVLADVVMPKKSGYEVCEAIKKDPALQAIPVLLLAGTFEAFDEPRARAVNANGHLMKPFESQALINKVYELVEGKAPAQTPGIPAPRPAAPAAPPPGAPMRPAGAPMAGGVAPGARPPGPGMPPPGAPPAAMRPPPAAPPAARPAPIAPPPPAAKAPAPSAPSPAAPPPAKKDVFGLGAGPQLETPLEEDWSDLGAPAAPAPRAAPIAPPPPEPEPGFGEELGFEEPPAPKIAAAPIELPEEPAEEPELAPMHAFVPPPEKVGHKPAPAAAPAPAAEGDGGEALLREALSKASRDVIERVVWEVVPQLAETIIKENLERLVKERQG